MALGLFRVCLVVVTAIINHPLLFPRENATVPENEEEIIRQMQAHQEKLQLEQLRLEEEMARLAADKEAEKEALERVAEEGQQQNESRTAWDLWSTLCMILFLVIEVWRQDHQDATSPECLGSDEDELPDPEGAPLRGLTLPNRATLDHFYERCIRGATADAARTREFVEGFVDDLLEALRSLCSRDSDMEVEDFIGVDSMYENWQVNKPLLCDLFVPFMPPEPYHFHPELWCSSRSVPLDRQGYGQIKVVRADEDQAWRRHAVSPPRQEQRGAPRQQGSRPAVRPQLPVPGHHARHEVVPDRPHQSLAPHRAQVRVRPGLWSAGHPRVPQDQVPLGEVHALQPDSRDPV